MTTRVAQYNFTDEQIIEAIKGSCGIISNIAASLNCDWHTAKKYINEGSEEVKFAYSDESERVIDKAESVILGALDLKDIQTAKWYLATVGKKRGYSEKHEIEHTGEISTKFSIIGIDAESNSNSDEGYQCN